MKALLLAAICGFVLTFSAAAQEIKQGVATVVRVQGEARYNLGDGNWHPLVAGKILTAGTVVQTAQDSLVDIVLGKQIAMPQATPIVNGVVPAPDAFVRGMVDYQPSAEQNVIRLSENTTLAIDKLTVSDTGVDTVSDTELDLRQGKIFASVKKLSTTSQYLVKIPNGIAGVRGTLFGLGADGWCGCTRHSVILSLIGPNGLPITLTIGEGNQFNPQTGQIIPLSAELLALLQQISTSLDTLYLQISSFAFDRTILHISPTAGHNFHPIFHFGGGNQSETSGGDINQTVNP